MNEYYLMAISNISNKLIFGTKIGLNLRNKTVSKFAKKKLKIFLIVNQCAQICIINLKKKQKIF